MRTCLYGHLITPPLITSLHFQRDIIGNSALKNITRFWLAENECILTWHEWKVVTQCKVVTRVQSWNANTSANYKQRAFKISSVFQRLQITLALRARALFVFEKYARAYLHRIPFEIILLPILTASLIWLFWMN